MLPHQARGIVATSIFVNLADQLIFAALPLIATAGGASAGMIALLVALHSVGWFVFSLPAGVAADRLTRRFLLTLGSALIASGGIVGLLASLAGSWTLVVTGIAAFVISAGVVITTLTLFAMMPALVARSDLAAANAANELARALVTLSAPWLAALLIARGLSQTVFSLVIAAGIAVGICARLLPEPARGAGGRMALATALRDGLAFVAANPLTRALALCAIFWNMGFFALTALLAPYAIREIGLAPEKFGQLWSAWGLGLVIAALTATVIFARMRIGTVLVFGPAASLAAAVLAAAAPRSFAMGAIALALLLLGFAPMLWAITQTTLRQALTPPELVGRVGATFQFLNYGVRPIGALLAGVFVTFADMTVAIWLPVLLFALSLAAILLSAAPATRELPHPVDWQPRPLR